MQWIFLAISGLILNINASAINKIKETKELEDRLKQVADISDTLDLESSVVATVPRQTV